MSLNTLHDKSKDKIEGYNVTQAKSFKYENLAGQDIRRIENIEGLVKDQLKIAIRVNGVCTIAINDKLKIRGQTYKVSAIHASEDDNQYGYKGFNNQFKGSTEIGLE